VLGPHNAEVEGSSPSLTNSTIKHLALRARSHNRQCGKFAGPQPEHHFQGLDQREKLSSGMTTELDVLGLVSDRLSARGLPFMLTGSFALAYYATPRMTRDLDLVVALNERDVDALVAAFTADFYIDAGAARVAIQSERMFNLMHLDSGVKVDLIVRKSSEFRQVEFARRRAVAIADIRTWIVSCEDLILSKLVWALDTNSELQRRDIRQLLAGTIDLDYIRQWAPKLGVTSLLNELMT
jgi:hypothetical protein